MTDKTVQHQLLYGLITIVSIVLISWFISTCYFMVHDRRKKSRFGSYRAFKNENGNTGGQNNHDDDQTMITFVQE